MTDSNLHTPEEQEMTDRPKDFREMALQKCYEVERHPASDEQTMASLVASAALHLADHGGYVEGDIMALHRAADFILGIPALKAEQHNQGVYFGVYDFADYLQSIPRLKESVSMRDVADDYFTDVDDCGDDLDV